MHTMVGQKSAFDRILVAASAANFPVKLVNSLKTDGYCVIPEGESSPGACAIQEDPIWITA